MPKALGDILMVKKKKEEEEEEMNIILQL